MIKRFKKWLVAKYLPERAAAALYEEVVELQRRLEECHALLEQAAHERDVRESYIAGLERNLRSRQVNISVRGGAEVYDK